jgi:hypothetical protein
VVGLTEAFKIREEVQAEGQGQEGEIQGVVDIDCCADG